MLWKAAVENEYDPGVYSYNANDIPLGGYVAILQFKIWQKIRWDYLLLYPETNRKEVQVNFIPATINQGLYA